MKNSLISARVRSLFFSHDQVKCGNDIAAVAEAPIFEKEERVIFVEEDVVFVILAGRMGALCLEDYCVHAHRYARFYDGYRANDPTKKILCNIAGNRFRKM